MPCHWRSPGGWNSAGGLGTEFRLLLAADGAVKPVDSAAKNSADGYSRVATEVAASPAGRSLHPHVSGSSSTPRARLGNSPFGVMV